ncbi:heptaprenyl diphosphate synthase component 1 [Rummeliibacillus pycnus]|uniref:heptaprenyl diphosphate synthase component 1 n=1 Tax=Rummeliibacillus pycnus TaxID=101070 RepID=UPI000C9B201A|nr:heptaprenyl diphosphate synthase component 1 [Rummeliibacillus pycnus]
MNATIIEEQVSQLKNNILQQLHHRTLLQFTGQPVIEDDQLLYLLLPKLNGEQWSKSLELAASAVAMIYAALSGHDLIDEQDATSKSQQLTVLAGDYYSGMYYSTLATIPDIQLIRSLSKTVGKVSECKTTFYEPEKRNLAEWFESLRVIEAMAIRQFMKRYNFDSYIEIAELGLVLARFKREMKQWQETHQKTRFMKILEQQEEYANLPYEQILQHQISELSSKLIRSVKSSPILLDEVKISLLLHIESDVREHQTMREG